MPRSSTCPVCGKPASASDQPFCSQGCRDRDLLQWLSEGYRLPASGDDPSASDGLDSTEIAD